MVNVAVLNQILSIRNGVYLVAVLVFLGVYQMRTIIPAVMEQLNRRKRDRADIEGEQYERMDARTRHLEERCEALEQAEDDCRRELNATKGRVAELEGYMMGRGRADQEASRIVAVERLTDSRKKKDEPDA